MKIRKNSDIPRNTGSCHCTERRCSKAGIQPGDVIIGFNENVIENFQQLKDLIDKQKVGDAVKVKVAGWQEFTLPVTLEPLPAQ